MKKAPYFLALPVTNPIRRLLPVLRILSRGLWKPYALSRLTLALMFQKPISLNLTGSIPFGVLIIQNCPKSKEDMILMDFFLCIMVWAAKNGATMGSLSYLSLNNTL